MLIIILSGCNTNESFKLQEAITWHSGAEKVVVKDRMYFLDDEKVLIRAANNRDSIVKFNGSYSSKLIRKGEYTFCLVLKDVIPGSRYFCSVWVKGDPENVKLVMSNKHQRFMGHDTKIRKNGWSLISGDVMIKNSNSTLKVYVKNMHEGISHVDEFNVYKLSDVPLLNVKNFNGFPEVNLEISADDQIQIKEKRAIAFGKNMLEAKHKDWMEVKLNSKNAKLKMKGDWLDHLSDHKWSLRIKQKEENKEFPSEFSIMNPLARGFILEWMQQKIMTQEGVMSTRYNFAFVNINGKAKGIYATEMHFTNDLLKANGVNERGRILKYDEASMWRLRAKYDLKKVKGVNYKFSTDILTYEKGEGVLNESFKKDAQVLDRLKFGQYNPKQLFDLKYEAKYFALVDLFSATHGIIWHNVRFYQDPISKRIYHIGFDLNDNHQLKVNEKLTYNLKGQRMYSKLFTDPEFRKLYLRYLKEYASENFLNQFLTTNREEFSKIKTALVQEYNSSIVSIQPVFERAKVIRKKISELDTVEFLNPKNKNLVFNIDTAEAPFVKSVSLSCYLQNRTTTNDSILIMNLYNREVEVVGYVDREIKKDVLFSGGELKLEAYLKAFSEPAKRMVSVPKKTKKMIIKYGGKTYKVKVKKQPYPYFTWE